MKCLEGLAALAVFGFVSCENVSRPLNSSGDFDPLNPPGGKISSSSSMTPMFKAGEFVRSSMDNTAFFKTRPHGDGDADKLLKRGTSMKVIAISGSYIKVELDSGEVGFVPSVMVENPNSAGVPTTNPGEFQVYPPLDNVPLPTLDPAGLPPEGSIPTVIDPEAPAVKTPVPAVTPTTDTFPTPVPLPPNGEETEAEKKAQ